MLVIFGTLLSLPLLLNLTAARGDYRKHVDAVFAAGMLCAIWAFTNIVAHIYPFPQSKEFHPLVDLIGLSAMIAAYMTQRQRWKFLLASLFFAQLCAHAWFWVAWRNSPEGGIGYRYILTLNLLWFGQLLCVGAPGGTYVANRALGWMRRHGSLPDPARS